MQTKAQLAAAYHLHAASNPLADTADVLELTATECHCSPEDVAEAVECAGVAV